MLFQPRAGDLDVAELENALLRSPGIPSIVVVRPRSVVIPDIIQDATRRHG